MTSKKAPRVRFSLAVRKRRGGTDVWWIQCEAYGKLANIIRDNYGKGDFILIKDGELQTLKNSLGRTYWVVRVRLIEYISRKLQNPDMEKDYDGEELYQQDSDQGEDI
jgi:single-stranded DNA-binding protein